MFHCTEVVLVHRSKAWQYFLNSSISLTLLSLNLDYTQSFAMILFSFINRSSSQVYNRFSFFPGYFIWASRIARWASCLFLFFELQLSSLGPNIFLKNKIFLSFWNCSIFSLNFVFKRKTYKSSFDINSLTVDIPL